MSETQTRLAYADPVLPGNAEWPPPILVGAAALLTVPSLLVVVIGAGEEPFYGPLDGADMLVQVGVASSLITLWGVWCLALGVLVARKVVRPVFLVLLVWPSLAISYLGQGVDGYVHDIITNQRMTPAPVPPPAATPATPPATPAATQPSASGTPPLKSD